MNLARRKFLGALAVSPVAAKAAAAEAAQALAGIRTGLAPLHDSQLSGSVVRGSPIEGKLFTVFTDWWKEHGDDEARQLSKQVSRIDADIACLSCPLATKVRMREKRNYEWHKESRRAWFERIVANGEGLRWL